MRSINPFYRPEKFPRAIHHAKTSIGSATVAVYRDYHQVELPTNPPYTLIEALQRGLRQHHVIQLFNADTGNWDVTIWSQRDRTNATVTDTVLKLVSAA